MSEQKTKRTSLVLTPPVHQALRLVCALSGETQSAVIGRLVQAELDRLEKQWGKVRSRARSDKNSGRQTAE